MELEVEESEWCRVWVVVQEDDTCRVVVQEGGQMACRGSEAEHVGGWGRMGPSAYVSVASHPLIPRPFPKA